MTCTLTSGTWRIGGPTSASVALACGLRRRALSDLGAHHISMDGHSINMLMFDINQAYNRYDHSLPPLPFASQARAFGEQQLLTHKAGKFQPAIRLLSPHVPVCGPQSS